MLSLQQLIYKIPLDSLSEKEYDTLADVCEALVDVIAELPYEQNGTSPATICGDICFLMSSFH